MRRCVLTLALLSLALHLAAQTNEPIKLALIAESAEVSAIADVLTAHFSTNPQIHLLERDEIAKVYHEQELSTANQDYIKLGQILGADGLLLLEPQKIGTNKFLRSRLVAVKTGIILNSERFPKPTENPAEWASGFADHLRPLLSKLTVPVRDAVPISVVDLRSAFQSPEERELEHDLTLLATESLSREPRVFVLERRRMQLLSAEKELGDIDKVFWDGSFLLDGTLDRDGYSQDKVTLNARLVPPQGRPPIQIEVSGSRTNISGIVLQLTRQVLDHLQVRAGAMPWNPSDEANQYEKEARWALRWGLFEAAQSASESAWALGKRTQDVAALRIRAYSESVQPIDEASGNIMVPAVPAARALALYCEDSSLALTNTTQPDLEWFDIGVKSLSGAARVLDSYYGSVELRRQNAESLAELRELARRILPKLDAQALLVDKLRRQFVNGREIPKGVRYESKAFQNCDRLTRTKWEEGGLFFERPEDSLPMFRDMIDRLKPPENLPRIIGWSWEDRKRVPQLMKQFLGELCSSTNVEIHLMGSYLSVLRAPNDEAGTLDAAADALMSGMWKFRTNLFMDPRLASLLPCTQTALERKYGDYFLAPFDREPFASFRRRFRMDYLTNAASDRMTEDVLFSILPRDSNVYTKEEAQELLPLLRQQSQKEPANRDVRTVMSALARATGTATPFDSQPGGTHQSNTASLPAAQLETLEFLPWSGVGDKNETGLHPQVQQIIYRAGKLWSMMCYMSDGSIIPFHSPTSFVEVDPETGQCEEIVFPVELGYPNSGFDAASDSLFVSLPGKLAWRRFAGASWETITLPTESGGNVLALNGRIYLANADNVLEIVPETHAIEILASSRRDPPINDLDRALGPRSGLFAGWGNQLGVYTVTNVFLFDLSKRNWVDIPLSNESFPSNSTWFPSRGSVQILSSRTQMRMAHRTLVGFSANHVGPELLLEQRIDGTNTEPATEPSFGQSRWAWPDPFRLDLPSLDLENEVLWFLQSRKLQWSPRPPEEPIRFNDERNATLLRFGQDSRQPLSIALKFEKDGKAFDPFISSGSSMVFHRNMWDPLIPLWLVTDNGVVITSIDKKPGHWFLPLAAVDRRMQAFLKTTGREGGAESAIPAKVAR